MSYVRGKEAIGKNLVDVRKDSLAVKNGRARL